MGALKHIVLPLCTIAHLFSISVFLFQGKEAMATLLDWPRMTVSLTPIERHLLGAGLAFHIVLSVNNIAAIIVENSHYRAMATFLELILYSLDLADAMYENTLLTEGMNLFTLVPLATMTGVALVGLVLHSQEPGLFTEDKNVKKKK